jgi:N6-L-threonylcarbamoyladenine synthase
MKGAAVNHTILAVETSCDETSAAVLRNGLVLSNVISSQEIHGTFGGVVPELASRAHMRLIIPVVDEALSRAGVARFDLSAISATYGPGLAGSLLVGLSFAKALAYGLGIPFLGVNHLEGHLYSNWLGGPPPDDPFLSLVVSGGHTMLVLVRGPFDYEVLGQTRDDAAGEAFDKVAKMLGLGYPGGPVIDRLAAAGNPSAIAFPRSQLEDGSLDFSFSGLKTSVLYYLRDKGESAGAIPDIAASFQQAVVDVLVSKTIRAAERLGVSRITIAGGVSANTLLRRMMVSECQQRGLTVTYPHGEYCIDNAAMIGYVGWLQLLSGRVSDLRLNAEPNLVL